MRFIHRPAALAATAFVAIAVLAGCSAGDSTPTASVLASAGSSASAQPSESEPTEETEASASPAAEACDAAYVELEAINDTVDEITAEMSAGDMTRTPELYDAMAGAVTSAEQALGFAEASTVFESMRAGAEGMRAASAGATSIDELSANPDFVAASARLDEGGAALGALCE